MAPLTVKRSNIGGRHKRVRFDGGVAYEPARGVDFFVAQVSAAAPMDIVALERHGVQRRFVKDLSKRIGISMDRLNEIMGISSADVERRAAKALERGPGGHAAVVMAQLIAKAQEMARDSTAEAAESFDAAKWLGCWIERPQPALGGRAPAELIATPTGAKLVLRLLGAVQSGTYQ